MKEIESTLRDAMKLKKVMLKRGITKAKAKCPECGGWLRGRLYKGRGGMNIAMFCEGTCKRSLMQ
jgi:hypothetical protein